jgi:hypothetical protein
VVRFLAAVSAVVSLTALPAAARTAEPAAQEALLSTYGHATLRPSKLAAFQTSEFWGGEFTAASGETVRVFISREYPEDPATGQRWADFLAGLVHGAELGTVRTYLVPFRDIEPVCGRGALACYSAGQETIVALAENAPDGTSAEAVLAHEYGHHVANSRLNTPWAAVERGTKRWASYVNVCSRSRAGTLFPGDEDRFYRLNPGEGFAEAYRLLNERRAGRPETPWDVVDQSLYPDEEALRLLEQDVREPWTQNSTVTLRGSFASGRTRVRSFSVATRLDGLLAVRLTGPAQLRPRIVVSARAGSRVLGRSRAGGRSVQTTVCGERAVRIRVERTRGLGAFRLAVSRP